MKHFNHRHMAILPLLAILAISPDMMEQKHHHGRSIASVTEVEKGHPKYEALVAKVKPDAAKDIELSADKFKEKLGGLKLNLQKEKEEFKKQISDESLVSQQRKDIESFVAELALIDLAHKDLVEKKVLEETDAKSSLEVITESKDIIEGLLSDLESNEVLVTKSKEPKKDDKPVVVQEEPKKEEPKKEQGPVITEEPKKEICEADEKNKILTKQVEELMKQNQQILQTMLGMTQMMLSMHQQQQQQQPNPYYANGPGFQTSPYQYVQPQTAGNWVYYPSGFQPQQSNIFAQPQMPQYQPQMGGIYPDQMHQSSWGLQPDPRFQVSPVTPGNFGNSGLGFNMSTPGPSLSQSPVMRPPVLGAPTFSMN